MPLRSRIVGLVAILIGFAYLLAFNPMGGNGTDYHIPLAPQGGTEATPRKTVSQPEFQPSQQPPSRVEGKQSGSCEPKYSSYRCISNGFEGSQQIHDFTIHNRSCFYENIVWHQAGKRFVYHASPEEKAAGGGTVKLPPISLASRPYDRMIQPAKNKRNRARVINYYGWSPQVSYEPIPCDTPRDNRIVGYYVPIVAPWNYAHTLFCDLFGLFWAAWEFGLTPLLDMQIVATSTHYYPNEPLPNLRKPNAAFTMFSTRREMYDVALPTAVYRGLLCGTGTKSWSWVTPQYAASGGHELWMAFRAHLMAVTGVKDGAPRHAALSAVGIAAQDDDAKSSEKEPAEDRKMVRVSICEKRDKRSIANYDEMLGWLETRFKGENVEFVRESAVGKTAAEQIMMMVKADIYMCNEGTLATNFFLMRPGSVFVSLPLIFHHAHLHQRKMPDAETWWRLPDPMRPDPRKKVGGNIDWFPPTIRWVHAMWYDEVPLNETKIKVPLTGLRNYMPDMSVVLQERKMVALMHRAIQFVRGTVSARGGKRWSLAANGEIMLPPPTEEQQAVYKAVSVGKVDATPPPNYSINANLCRQLLELTPSLTDAYNSAKCLISMSWLCEMHSNTEFHWRLFHPKWQLSQKRNRCGDRSSSVEHMGLFDLRTHTRPREQYVFFDREQLRTVYETSDLGKFEVQDSVLDSVFPPDEKNGTVGGDDTSSAWGSKLQGLDPSVLVPPKEWPSQGH